MQDRELPDHLTKLLFSLMQNSSFRIKWKGETSPPKILYNKRSKNKADVFQQFCSHVATTTL